MARYTTTVRSPWPVEKAFAYMADVRNFERWDPGVRSSQLVSGDEPGTGAAYRVEVNRVELRYETIEFDAPTRTVVEARSRFLRSYDVIEVSAAADGCNVSYDATLTLNGPLRLADPLLRLVFDRIGDRAAQGMADALVGKKVA